MAESYFQHAEHYFRILNAMAQAQQQGSGNNPNQQGQSNGQPNGQQRRPSMHDTGLGDQGDSDDMDSAPGFGDQPSSDMLNGESQSSDARQIPIAAVPPEG